MHNQVHAFAMEDRVTPERPLSTDIPPSQAILDIPIQSYLPSVGDMNMLRYEMEVLVQRMLVMHLACFDDLKEAVWWHILHPHQEASAKKSKVVR